MELNEVRSESIKTVERFLDALRAKDLSQAPLADGLKFDNPITGAGRGRSAMNAFLSGFLAAINDITVIEHIADGNTVATHFEVDAVFGNIPIMQIFIIRDGLIVESRAFFDPRPILGP